MLNGTPSRQQPNQNGRSEYIDYNTPAVSSFHDSDPNTPAAAMQFSTAEILQGSHDNRSNGVQNGLQRSTRQRNSPSLDDPITTHLLVETALGDSQSYDVLPYDELEDMKREDKSLQNRLYIVRRQLALETKVRDAARSLGRLYSRPASTASSPRLRRSSSNMSNKDMGEKAKTQLDAATKKVEELSHELYYLEQRLRTIETKLLQHTAGILQMTHRGNRNANGMMFASSGRPDSPASLDEEYDRGFHQGLDNLDGFLDQLKSGPKKDSSKGRPRGGSRQEEAFLGVGRQLEHLNDRMREMIAQMNPERADSYADIPRLDLESTDVEVAVAQQVEYLNRGLEDICAEQGAAQSRALNTAKLSDLENQNAHLQVELQASLQESMTLEQQKSRVEDDIHSQLGQLNNDLRDLVSSVLPNDIPPIIPSDEGYTELFRYTQDRISDLRNSIQSLAATSQASADQIAQSKLVLEGLWQIILAEEDDSRERKRSERDMVSAKRAVGPGSDSDIDLSPDENDEETRSFSLQAFSTKVQRLMRKSSSLKENQSQLRRKIQQHQEVARSRALDLPTIEDLKSQVERTRDMHDTAKGELQNTQSDLKSMQKTLVERDARITALEEEFKTVKQKASEEMRQTCAALQAKLDETESKAKKLESQLAAVAAERAETLRSHADQEHVFRKTTAEMRDLESEVVRLTTELTISKAELDAAYGSRSQRQADWAAAANTEAAQRLEQAEARNVQLSEQIDVLKGERDTSVGLSVRESELRKELGETLRDFEELAKASVEAERERYESEAQIDKLREKLEVVEAELADEKVKLLGTGGGGGGGSPGSSTTAAGQSQQSTSAMVLKNEFKKMMRDTRTEHMKILRAEQEERRRLELVIKNMKKDKPGSIHPKTP